MKTTLTILIIQTILLLVIGIVLMVVVDRLQRSNTRLAYIIQHQEQIARDIEALKIEQTGKAADVIIKSWGDEVHKTLDSLPPAN